MGPGYFPMLLGGFLGVLGVLICLKSLLFRSEDPDNGIIGQFDWRSFSIILGAVLVFAFLLRPMGLIPATAIMIFLSSFGARPFKWLQVMLLCLILSVCVWLIFVLGLNLTVPIWPGFFS